MYIEIMSQPSLVFSILRLLVLLLCCLPGHRMGVVAGQNTHRASEEYLLVLTADGNRFVGKVLYQDSATVTLSTRVFTEIAIPRAHIKSTRWVPAQHFSKNIDATETPIYGTYFVNSSAYGIPRGSGYYMCSMLLFHQVGVGLSDHFSLRGGVMIDFDAFYFPSVIVPKVSIPIWKDRLHAAVEGLIGRGFDDFHPEYTNTDLTMLQGLITIGNRADHLTVGGGVSWSGGRWGKEPYFSLAGTKRIAERFSLIAESISFLDYDWRVFNSMVGGRIYGRKINFDFAVVWSPDYDEFLPWASLSVNFY